VEKLLHTTDNFVPHPNYFGVENATEVLKRHKLSGIIQVATERVQAGGETL
jgi:hypothetical protein